MRGYEKSASVHMTGKDMDVLHQNVKRLTEIVDNVGKLQSEEGNEKRRERERERERGMRDYILRKWLRMMRWIGSGKKEISRQWTSK